MGESNIRACQRVIISRETTRYNRGRMMSVNKFDTKARKICAEMPSEIEALAELDRLVEGICPRPSTKSCSVEKVGEPDTEPVRNWVATFTQWVRNLGIKAASRELPEYPTGPARPKY